MRDLPNSFIIYRGTSRQEVVSQDYGLSWTWNIRTARFFANRFKHVRKESGGPIVLRADVKKADVWAYLEGRKEYEVIVSPDKVKNVMKLVGEATNKLNP